MYIAVHIKDKMENTLENKKRFFAQYWGQSIETVSNFSYVEDGEKWIWSIGNRGEINGRFIELCDHFVLLLTPLSEISCEDSIDVAYLNGHRQSMSENGKDDITNFLAGDDWCIGWKVYQYLQSKGYALPYMDLSVEQLIEYGWLKLQEA